MNTLVMVAVVTYLMIVQNVQRVVLQFLVAGVGAIIVMRIGNHISKKQKEIEVWK